MKVRAESGTVRFRNGLKAKIIGFYAHLTHSAARPAPLASVPTQKKNPRWFPEVGVPRGDLRSSTTKCNVTRNTIGSTCDLTVGNNGFG